LRAFLFASFLSKGVFKWIYRFLSSVGWLPSAISSVRSGLSEGDVGTLVIRGTKQQVVRDTLQDLQACASVLASRVIGNRLWYLARMEGADGSTTTWIGLSLIESRRGEVFVKSMDESSGPFYYDCPLAFLSQADAPIGPYAAAWREQVRAFHAARLARRAAVRAGARVQYGTQVFVLVRSLRRSGWRVRRESDGVSFRMSSRQLAKAELLPAEGPHAPPKEQVRHQAQRAEGERVL
jgi:hypothetical protein